MTTSKGYRESECMAKDGMAPVQALHAATVVDANIPGKQGKLGMLKRGFLADVIAVKGDPTRNTDAIEKVPFVMNGGRDL